MIHLKLSETMETPEWFWQPETYLKLPETIRIPAKLIITTQNRWKNNNKSFGRKCMSQQKPSMLTKDSEIHLCTNPLKRQQIIKQKP